LSSTFTTRKLINKQGTGDNPSSWGSVLNSGALDVLDFALDGWTTLAISGDHTLSSANGTTSGNEAGARMLKLTTATSTYTQTLPAREGWYLVWNATTASQTIASTGGGTSVSIKAGEKVWVACDGTNVIRLTLTSMESQRLQNVADPTSAQDAATKKYVDDTAFSSAAGNLPGQTGNAGAYLTTNGSVASWTTFSANAAAVRAGTSTAVALTPGDTYNALAEVSLTDAATIAVDLSAGINFALNPIAGNRTLGNPTNPKAGQSGRIRIVQDGSGNRTLAFAGNWKRQGGAPSLSTTAGATDFIYYDVISSTYILYDIRRNPS
jgi:hypothetical protein